MTPERTCSFASRHSRKFFATFVTPLCAEPSTKGEQHFGESTQSIETIRCPRDHTDAHDEGISRLVSLPPASPINGRADSLDSHIAPVRKVRGCVSTVIRHDTSPTLQLPVNVKASMRSSRPSLACRAMRVPWKTMISSYLFPCALGLHTVGTQHCGTLPFSLSCMESVLAHPPVPGDECEYGRVGAGRYALLNSGLES